jgi:hypothetical protein
MTEPRHPLGRRKWPLSWGFSFAGRTIGLTAAGLVVTELSHLGVGLTNGGGFRGPVRFAVSSQPSWRHLSKHDKQYFEMMGNRAMYHDGWDRLLPSWPAALGDRGHLLL